MANFKNSNYFTVTGKQTVPANANGTGTIETVGKAVKGTGTLFTTEMPVGSWLVDESQDEIRIVTSVTSDTLAYVSNPFTTDIPALTTPSIIAAKDAKAVSIAVAIPAGLAAGEIDGVAFAGGSSIAFSKDSRDHSASRDLVDPLIVDGTGTTMQILIQY